jgi:hypothetical protein
MLAPCVAAHTFDAAGAVMIITLCGYVAADYFGRVDELFTGDIAEK